MELRTKKRIAKEILLFLGFLVLAVFLVVMVPPPAGGTEAIIVFCLIVFYFLRAIVWAVRTLFFTKEDKAQ
jgi:hypothetical protein